MTDPPKAGSDNFAAGKMPWAKNAGYEPILPPPAENV